MEVEEKRFECHSQTRCCLCLNLILTLSDMTRCVNITHGSQKYLIRRWQHIFVYSLAPACIVPNTEFVFRRSNALQ